MVLVVAAAEHSSRAVSMLSARPGGGGRMMAGAPDYIHLNICTYCVPARKRPQHQQGTSSRGSTPGDVVGGAGVQYI